MLRLKKVTKRNCVECGFPVSGGGNCHAAGHHVIRSKHGDRYHSLFVKREMRINTQLFDQRGASVAGIHNAGASSPNRGKKKSEAEKAVVRGMK